jgi:hypothetical protein
MKLSLSGPISFPTTAAAVQNSFDALVASSARAGDMASAARAKTLGNVIVLGFIPALL